MFVVEAMPPNELKLLASSYFVN